MKTVLLVTAALGVCLMAVFLLGKPTPLRGQDLVVTGSDKDLGYQIRKLDEEVKRLEARVSDLQKQLKQLEANPRAITIPGSQIRPGYQLPPGSKSHDVNGIQFWTIPVH